MDFDERDRLRREMRQRRRALSRQERLHRTRHLTQRLGGSSLFRRSRNIGFYLPNDGEVDLTALTERAWAMGKCCYLPVLSPAFHNRLWFTLYQPNMPLLPNEFGIPEPERRWRHSRPAWSLDLVLTPLVAFDPSGNRLGMGGGFYDRTLAYLHQRACWRKPKLFGVAFDFQCMEKLPHAPWDVPLNGVITDVRSYQS